MKRRQLMIPARLGAVMTAFALVAAGCGGDGGGDTGSGAEEKTINMGVIPGWTDQTSTAYLLKNVLEAGGYTVDITELSDNAPMYTALSEGDIDVLSSGWSESLHKPFIEQYGNIEDIGTYYEGAGLFLAVPEYSEMQSISDLPANADELGGRIVGIEPGAGLTKTTKEEAFPAYGLDEDFKLVLSSTTAMLTELKKATDSKEEIVVTLWKPFWANQAFPVRALEDPEGAFGEPEGLHVLSREGFSEDFPEVAAMMESFKLDDEQYGTLEDTIVNEFGQGEEEAAVQAWLDANPDYAPALAEYLEG